MYDRRVEQISIFNQNPTFNEFAVKLPISSQDFLDKMKERGFFAGLKLENLYEDFHNMVLISATEKRTKKQMDDFVASVKEIL